jgi:hypothetical protein
MSGQKGFDFFFVTTRNVYYICFFFLQFEVSVYASVAQKMLFTNLIEGIKEEPSEVKPRNKMALVRWKRVDPICQ